MVRQRKQVTTRAVNPTRHNNGASSSSNNESTVKPPFRIFSFWKTILGILCLSIAIYVGTLGYLETRVNTPFDHEKVVTDTGVAVPERYWGSYRPGVYFGMKARDPRSPVFGLMWYQPTSAHRGIRHWCEQGDNLQSYGWVRHDGVSFGEQLIQDPPFTIRTSFVKTPGGERGGHWTARLEFESKSNRSDPMALIWYGALDEALGVTPEARIWEESGHIVGHTPATSNFKITFHTQRGRLLHTSHAEAYVEGLHLLKEKMYSLLEVAHHKTFGDLVVLSSETDLHMKDQEVNLVAYQLLVESPYVVDVVYTTQDVSAPPLKGQAYSGALRDKAAAFDSDFEEKFQLAEKGYPPDEVAVARAALSNMIGGIGYFYGAGRVQSQHTSEPVPYWRAALYTGVPSRSFFPRGFLWDEGFHGLLIGRWSPHVQMDIAAHWMDLINVEGWIPREQILGAEALARVPKEFVVQSNQAANPPMLLIQLARTVASRPKLFASHTPHRRTLDRMYTRLQAWYQWFQNSQKGTEATAYRWRGRFDDGLQLNPKTLASGLDDYPRASHPSEMERHVDLRCWMYAAADAMVTISRMLQRDASKYEETRNKLGDEEILNELHWSPHAQAYADFGMHTDGVKLARSPAKPQEPSGFVRVVSVPPHPRLVTSAFGYVSLFPMLLKVLKPGSSKLGKILSDLDNPELLWSPYGLRSLATTSPYFMKRNTEHDPPYWRGQVWININFLALDALKYYATVDGPYAQRAEDVRRRLRENLVRNVLFQYKRTGYLWEQYSSEDGRGSGCRPFTGWTALVVLIMADEY